MDVVYNLFLQQMRRTGNKDENKRILMDLDVVLKSHDCPYIIQCYGAIVTNVSGKHPSKWHKSERSLRFFSPSVSILIYQKSSSVVQLSVCLCVD